MLGDKISVHRRREPGWSRSRTAENTKSKTCSEPSDTIILRTETEWLRIIKEVTKPQDFKPENKLLRPLKVLDKI